MPVDFSVKRVPDAIARRLRERAERNHRSLQRELLCILEAAAVESVAGEVAEPRSKPYRVERRSLREGDVRKAKDRLSLDELWDRARRIGGPIPGEPATSIVRSDRDERSRH